MGAYKHIVIDQQWLGDIAIQCAGSIEGVVDLAVDNDVSVTEELVSGHEIEYTEIKNKPMHEWFRKNSIFPASRKSAVFDQSGEIIEPVGGIGYMGIQIDFIVS